MIETINTWFSEEIIEKWITKTFHVWWFLEYESGYIMIIVCAWCCCNHYHIVYVLSQVFVMVVNSFVIKLIPLNILQIRYLGFKFQIKKIYMFVMVFLLFFFFGYYTIGTIEFGGWDYYIFGLMLIWCMSIRWWWSWGPSDLWEFLFKVWEHYFVYGGFRGMDSSDWL